MSVITERFYCPLRQASSEASREVTFFASAARDFSRVVLLAGAAEIVASLDDCTASLDIFRILRRGPAVVFKFILVVFKFIL
ncbi:MAG TPA: hypothetical protein DC048_05295 [Planctomycetaceae bacterium]|nr:hypothetical protein [Planctomycetaceae bacterium]